MRSFSYILLLVAILLNTCVFAQDGAVTATANPDDREPFTIKLDPVASINPVRTQHTFIATVLDSQGRPVPGQRVEWILSRGPQMVGDIVLHDDMGSIVGGTNEIIRKIDNHYTVTYTNEAPVVLDMGTPNTDDDITVGVGQTWITITSPVEGETHVIAFCPNIRNANRHKAFAVKYWIDALITWPENAVNKVDEQHTFTFNLVKASTSAPMSGYIVRWSIVEDENAPKAFLGSEPGNTVIETQTDDMGNASVTLTNADRREGTTRVRIELRGPDGRLLAVYIVNKEWIAPRLTVIKRGPAEGILEENVVFTIEVSNPGEADAHDVVIRDRVPQGFMYMSADLEPEVTADRELVWNIGTIARNETVRITVTMKAKATGELTNTAVVTSREAEPQTATAVVRIGAPELYVIKEGTAQIREGEVAEYRLTVRNSGSAVAREVVVRDEIPEGFEFVSSSGKSKMSPMTFRWDIGDMQPGQEKVITYSLRGKQVGAHTNVASAIVRGEVVHRAEFITTVVAPRLRVVKNGPRLMYLHRTAEYVIQIFNEGNGSALDVEVVDTIPDALDYINATPRGMLRQPTEDRPLATVTWKLPEIPANSTVEIKLELRAKKRAECVNTVRVISNSTRPPVVPPLTAEVATRIIGIPAMHIWSYDTEDPVEVGKQTIYVIEVRNEGTSPCTNVKMHDTIPKEMEFVQAEGPGPHNWSDSERAVIFEPHPILQPGDKLVYRIRCRAITRGSAKNTARLNYDQFDDVILDEEGTSVYQ